MENPIKIDDLGVPLFLETPIYNHLEHTYIIKQIAMGILRKKCSAQIGKNFPRFELAYMV